MLTCKEASLLASKKLDKKLTFRERMSFTLHTAMCHLCRHYAKEISELHKLIQQADRPEDVVLTENEQLSKQSRERIKQAIDKALHSTE